MGIVERLTLDAASADTMIACEHRHRYEFAAPLCDGLRVLDLCCGSGYGTAILATRARSVTGVDIDAATVEHANATVAAGAAHVRFEAADALRFLGGPLPDQFDVIVCFEGLEHVPDLPGVLAALRRHAEAGVRIIASLPNGKLFREDNPFHVTEFGYDEARRTFAGFPALTMLPQFLAEGSLICPPDADGVDVTVSAAERGEPEYANHFIFCSGVPAIEVAGVHHGRIQVNTSPVFNRWAENLKLAARALRRENARLARERLGQGGSAAATALRRLLDHGAELERARQEGFARGRAEGAALSAPAVEAPPPAVIELPQPPAIPAPGPIDGDPNTWAHRHRRARDCLLPWIERSVPLAGATVLEYGCGNAPVSCAIATRCDQVVGVDIDARWIDEGRKHVEEQSLSNVRLEHHPLSEIAAAVRGRAGQIDVFLLYAVLEHMTVQERLDVLALARDVLAPGGAIVVCETPNRLFPFDHHTAQLPFFHALPPELALPYSARSQRTELTAALDSVRADPVAAREAVIRWGTGVSFHEFEVVFGDLARHVIGSSYDRDLTAERPLWPEELMLARYLDRARPDLAPAWSRAWLDVILSPTPVTRRAPFIRPWTATTVTSREVGWTRWDTLRLAGERANLAVSLPHPTARLVVAVVADEGAVVRLLARPRGETRLLAAEAKGSAHRVAWLEFAWPAPAAEIDLGCAAPVEIVFVGYED